VRIAFLSDIHGNDVALNACLSVMAGLDVSEHHFIGDAVGYLPGEIAVLNRLESLGAYCQQGNHEAMLLSKISCDHENESQYKLNRARARLESTGWIEKIMGWPTLVSRTIAGKRFLLVHGSPTSPLYDYIYPDSDLSSLKDIPYDFVVMGNTHRPFVRKEGDIVFANLGSIGLPRDRGNLASFGIYEIESQEFSIVRVPINVEEILRVYGSDIHEAVAACFQRKAAEVFGKIVNEFGTRI